MQKLGSSAIILGECRCSIAPPLWLLIPAVVGEPIRKPVVKAIRSDSSTHIPLYLRENGAHADRVMSRRVGILAEVTSAIRTPGTILQQLDFLYSRGIPGSFYTAGAYLATRSLTPMVQ